MSTDTERKPLRLAKGDITCKLCGTECYWQEVWGKEGKPEIKLFEGGKPHQCDHTADFD